MESGNGTHAPGSGGPHWEPIPHERVHEHPQITRCDVIGDVHGCYDELVELLDTLGHGDLLHPDVEPAPPGQGARLIFVGDLVDRGDRIMDCVRLVHRLYMRGHALSVIGNHDDRFMRWLCGKPVEPKHGMQETVSEFMGLPDSVREEWRKVLVEFFSGLPWAIRIDSGRAIVAHAAWHAALKQGVSSDKLRYYTLYGPTTGKRTPEGFPDRIDWAPKYSGPEFVVFGHQVYSEPYINNHAIGIDTGCVFGGALTALRYPAKETVRVESRGARYLRRGGRSETFAWEGR